MLWQVAGVSRAGGGVIVGLSYADAVRLLGGRQSRTVTALDHLAGGLLLVASAAGSGFALSLFEAKGELARLSGELVQGLGERLRGLDRFARSERLAAAHSVVALTAYFEVLAHVDLPVHAQELELTKSEELEMNIDGPASDHRYWATSVLLPSPVGGLGDAEFAGDVGAGCGDRLQFPQRLPCPEAGCAALVRSGRAGPVADW